MSKLIKLINRCKCEHSLGINALVYFMYKIKICGKYTAGLVSMDYTYYKIEKKFRKKAKALIANYYLKGKNNFNKTVWLFWWQGIDLAPELVKSCYESVIRYFADWNIVVIDKNNYFEYITLPDYIIDKHNANVITHTHFSDILRLALLCRYGGLWMDATVYCTGEIYEEYMEQDLFCFRNGWMDQENINFASWFICAKSNDPILSVSLELLYDYWKSHNYLVHYFLLHMFVKIVTDELPDKWGEVPYYNHNDNHLLAEELEKKFNRERYDRILRLTNFHKLSYKINVSPTDKSTTYYHIIHGKESFR